MQNTSRRVALFIPTFNVETTAVEVLRKIPEEVYRQLTAIYIFDNKSSDKTVEKISAYILSESKAKIQLFKNSENYLLGGSTVLAFNKAIEDKIDYLICMHSDGQADPKNLLKFSEHLDKDYDFILGSRFLKNSKVEDYSRLRYLFNIIFVYFQWLILKQKVYDIGAFIGFKIDTIKQVSYQDIAADMGYHPYLIMVISHLLDRKLKFKEFPISWGKVEDSNVNLIRYGVVHLTRIFKLMFGHISKQSNRYSSQQIA